MGQLFDFREAKKNQATNTPTIDICGSKIQMICGSCQAQSSTKWRLWRLL